MNIVRASFFKIMALFLNFEKGQGRPPPHPSSYAPVNKCLIDSYTIAGLEKLH